jgi:hypothetical protein
MASPLFRLYVPLLALNSGSGGQSRASLKQDFSGYTSFHTSRDESRGFFIAGEETDGQQH